MPAKLTQDGFLAKARAVHGERYDYSKTVYEHSMREVTITCRVHGDFQQKAYAHVRGEGCRLCGYEEAAANRSDGLESFLSRASKKFGGKFDYSKTEMLKLEDVITVTCPDHGDFTTTAYNFLVSAHGCQDCAKIENGKKASALKKIPVEEVITLFTEKHGSRYLYDALGYTGKSGRVSVGCRLHGYFNVSVSNHAKGSGCPECDKITRNRKNGIVNRSTKQENLLAALNEKYGERVDFSEMLKVRRMTDYFTAVCQVHGGYQTTVRLSLYNPGSYGCKKCSCTNSASAAHAATRAKAVREMVTSEYMLRLLHEKQGHRYQYVLPERLNKATRVIAVCPDHGEFSVMVSDLLKGHGCAKCHADNNRVAFSEFLTKAQTLYADSYIYGNYSRITAKVKFVCKTHGIVEQLAVVHLRGGGCPLCGEASVSREEIDLANEVEAITGASVLRNDRSLISPKELDIVVPSKSLAIEYCGTYWHSDRFIENPDTHRVKMESASEKGFRLITVFSDEWINTRLAVTTLLATRLGSSKKMQGPYALIENMPESAEFLGRYCLTSERGHRSISVSVGNSIVASAEFSFANLSTVRLVRYCRLPGVCDLALSLVVDYLLQFGKVVATVDLRWFSGSSFVALGFSTVSKSPPEFFYTKGDRRIFKDSINPLEFSGYVLGLTQEQNMRRLGWAKIYDCGSLYMEKAP